MAAFEKAFTITVLGNEGGYNPGIGEKETYMGIDRGVNPRWNGWDMIDMIKKNNPGLNTAKMNFLLSQNLNLQVSIKQFYKTNYWDTVNLDQVNDQQLANNLFDCSVNQGECMARKFAQVACNYVIAAGKNALKPLVADRQIGPATITAVNCLDPAQLNAEINAEREASYRSDVKYAEWGKTWGKRLKQYT